jgi:hypothetical protein
MNAFEPDWLFEEARFHSEILALRGNTSQPKLQTTRKIAIHCKRRTAMNRLDFRRLLWLPLISTPLPH